MENLHVEEHADNPVDNCPGCMVYKLALNKSELMNSMRAAATLLHCEDDTDDACYEYFKTAEDAGNCPDNVDFTDGVAFDIDYRGPVRDRACNSCMASLILQDGILRATGQAVGA